MHQLSRLWHAFGAAAFSLGIAFCSSEVAAQIDQPSASDLGGIGLLQTRTARFGEDGSFEVGVSNVFPYRRYLLNVQALPWIEGTFRYTDIQNRGFFSGGGITDNETSFKDRGADIKIKILSEGRWRPALAAGLQDGLGTGQFSGEYLVASKRFFDFDFSIGMGWGYLGSRGGIKNPFAFFSDTFKSRGQSGGSAFGGTFNASDWFRGEEVALFGGVEYQTPIRGISLKLEYEGNDYQSEPLSNQLVQDTPFNIGINLRPYNWVDLSLAFERGREFMFRTSLRTNFHTSGLPELGRDPPPPLRLRPAAASVASLSANSAAGRRVHRPLEERRVPDVIGPVEQAFRSVQGSSIESYEVRGGFAYFATSVDGTEDVGLLPLEVAAATVFKVYPAALDKVVFDVGVRDTGAVYRQVISADTLSRREIVDFLFDESERQGLDIVEISFSDRQITVSAATPVTRAVASNVSSAIFLALPTAAETVVVMSTVDGATHVAQRRSDEPGTSEASRIAAVSNQALVDGSATLSPAAAIEIFRELQEQGVVGEEVRVKGNRMVLAATNVRYREQPLAVGRAVRVLANHAPNQVVEFDITMRAGGLNMFRTIIRRPDFERAVSIGGSIDELAQIGDVLPPGTPIETDPGYSNPTLYPAFSWGVGPVLKQHVGGGDVFYAYALGVRASAQVQIIRGLTLTGGVSHNLTDTFDKLTVTSSATLPHVRSDIREYLQATDTSITRTQLDYLFQMSPELYGRVSAGLFEEMFGGYGGEVLFRPFGSRLAASVDLNWVRQRTFQQRFSFQDYSVITGHLNLYYNLPYQNFLLQANIGQYLAGDRGVTFQVSRRFDSGVRAGVFATLTDVPFSVFGEGSFDKGFFISIPFDLFSIRPTRRTGTFGFRPLTKDGGQRLSIGPRLYDVTAQGNLDEIVRDFGSILE